MNHTPVWALLTVIFRTVNLIESQLRQLIFFSINLLLVPNPDAELSCMIFIKANREL